MTAWYAKVGKAHLYLYLGENQPTGSQKIAYASLGWQVFNENTLPMPEGRRPFVMEGERGEDNVLRLYPLVRQSAGINPAGE